MFRSTTVTIRNNFSEIPQSALIDSAKKEQEFDLALLHSPKVTAGHVSSVALLSPDAAHNNKPDISKLGDQAQGFQGHKVGFSFAFPKKASVKLESSAAAFCENNDDTTAEHGLSRRSRFVPGPCNLQASSDEESALCSEDKPSSVGPLVEKHIDKTDGILIQNSKEPPSEERMIPEDTVLCPVTHLKEPGLSDGENVCVNVAASLDETQPGVALGNQAHPAESNTNEHVGNKCAGPPVNEDCLSQQDVQEENDQSISSHSPTTEVEIKKSSSDGLIPTNPEGDTIALPCKQDSQKRLCEPFVPVLNKHGSTILQWPSEMLIYTNTEPSISYSCNPLCFDFRSSRSSDCLEKNKPQSNVLNSPQKTEASQSLVLDYPDKSLSTHVDFATNINTHPCDHVTSVTTDVSVAEGCNPYRKLDEVGLDTLCRAEKKENDHNPPKCIQQGSSVYEQQNNGWVKRTCEKWFHKKRKRRRKLCHHHYRKSADADTEFSPMIEQQHNLADDDKYQKLHNTLEEGMGENGLGCSVAEQFQQSAETLGVESSDHSGRISLSTQDHENQSPYSACNTKDDRDDCIIPTNLWRRSKLTSHCQANKSGLNSGRCSSVYSGALCSWSMRKSSSSPDHKYLGPHSDEKFTHQTQPLKRAYHSLADESERSHRKRRHHTHSCSSDESSYAQSCSSDENLRRTRRSVASCKPKRKRRRKRARIPCTVKERTPKKDSSVKSPKEVSTFSNSPKISADENTEQTQASSITDYANSMENTIQPVESQTARQSELLLPSENIQGSKCSVTENAPALEELTHPASPVAEHSVLATTKPRNMPEQGEKHDNVYVPESQVPTKVPTVGKNLDHPLPKAYLCHYEVAETIPQEKLIPSANEWLRYNPGIFNSPPPLPFKEAHINSHAFLTTEQILSPFTLPEHALLLPPDNHDKFKDLQCEAYHQLLQQNMLASKMKLTFPPTAILPSNAPLQPLPLQQPLCSTSVTTIHHTVLQQHAAAAAAAAASTFKILQPHQQFFSQVPPLSRTSLPHLSVGPRLCPAGHTAIVGPPQLPLIPASVLHPNHLAFPPLPHALFPSLLSPHPTIIPLQPLF